MNYRPFDVGAVIVLHPSSVGVSRESTTTRYEILVRGEFGRTLARELGTCRREPRPEGTLITIEIIDQSHLHGVLERLRDLNVDIASVNPA